MLVTKCKGKNDVTIMQPFAFTDSIRLEAQKKHAGAVKENKLEGKFEDDLWRCTDEKNTVNIDFTRKQAELKALCVLNNVKYDDYISDLRVVTILHYGTCGLLLLRSVFNYIIDETVRSEFFSKQEVPKATQHGAALAFYRDFLLASDYAPEEYLDMCEVRLATIREQDARSRKNNSNVCPLNEFVSYLKFDEYLRDFWDHCSDSVKRAYYYPLYLFWIITTILPLRVTEFCVTPYDCLKKDGDQYYLTIRRSRLKGNSVYSPKIHLYSIDADTYKVEYEIPAWLYELVDGYRTLTKDFAHPFGLLFSMDHILSLGMGNMHTSDHNKPFLSKELRNMLRDFYVTEIQETYKLKPVSEGDLLLRYISSENGTYELMDNEIMVLQPRHTRHISMINLVLRGCNPMIIKDFAGHANEAMSAHYYRNTCNLIRCGTKYYYDISRNRKAVAPQPSTAIMADPLSILIDESGPYIEVDSGRCFSPAMLQKDASDCQKCDGNCHKCRWHKADKHNPSNLENTGRLENKIYLEIEFLRKMLKSTVFEERIEEYQLKTQQLNSDISDLATIYARELGVK